MPGIKKAFNLHNQSLSAVPGVYCGMHYQMAPYAQTCLVRVEPGVVADVLVDIRMRSPTYGHWVRYIQRQYNHRQLLVPCGFAHGFIL